MESIKMKSVTGREIYDAIKENGWDWVREQYIDYDPTNGIVYGACAIGQAELNLKANIHESLHVPELKFEGLHPFTSYLNNITGFNDEEVSHEHLWEDDEKHYDDKCVITYHSYEEIVAFAEEVLTPVFDTVFVFVDLGFDPVKG